MILNPCSEAQALDRFMAMMIMHIVNMYYLEDILGALSGG